MTYLCSSEMNSFGISIWGSESDLTPLFSRFWNRLATFISLLAFLHSSEEDTTVEGISVILVGFSVDKCLSSSLRGIEDVRSWFKFKSLKLLLSAGFFTDEDSTLSSTVSDSSELRSEVFESTIKEQKNYFLGKNRSEMFKTHGKQFQMFILPLPFTCGIDLRIKCAFFQ